MPGKAHNLTFAEFRRFQVCVHLHAYLHYPYIDNCFLDIFFLHAKIDVHHAYIGINAFKIICFAIYNRYCVIGFYFELPGNGITVDEDVGIVELCVNYSEADNLPLNVSAIIYGGKVFNKISCVYSTFPP